MSAAGSVNGGVLELEVANLPDLSDLPDPAFYLVLAHLARERVAVDAERIGGLGEAAPGAAEDARDEAPFELANRVLELDAAVDHFLDQLLQAFRDHPPYSSSRPVRRR